MAASLTWGIVYTLDQKALVRNSAAVALFVDSILGVVITGVIIFMSRKGGKELLGMNRHDFLILVVAAGLSTMASYFIFSGIKGVGASSAALIEISYPLFVVLFSWFAFGGTPSATYWVGMIFIVSGAALIVSGR